jgi:zinc/manganese transport system substrate-binding protein
MLAEPYFDLPFDPRLAHSTRLVIMILNIMITILIRKRLAALMTALLLLIVVACGGTDEESESISVVVTTSIWGDVVEVVLGSAPDVLIPRGVDAHEFQPSSAQIADLVGADLIVANGMGLEEGLLDALESAEQEGAVVLYLADLVEPIRFQENDLEADETDHEQGSLDPHVWFDPDRVAMAANAIANALLQIDPIGDYLERAADYQDELESAHSEITRLLARVTDRELVTNHEALGYFADKYDFEVIGVVIPGGSSLGDPSSADLAELVATIREHEVRAVFAETTQATALAGTVAAEVGAEVAVVQLHTESLAESGEASTLIGMLLENARLIAEALVSDPLP